MQKVLLALLFSLCLHLILGAATLWTAQKISASRPDVAEIEIIEAPQTNTPKPPERSLVREAIVPEKMKIQAPEDDTLARFLSARKQRVREESQAALNGMTENRTNTPSADQPRPTEPPRQRTRAEVIEKDGYRTVDISKELHDMNRFNAGLSSVGESLPTDVKIGSFTALNTDRYLYYTFYARMEELVRYRWESRVYAAIEGFDRSTLMRSSNKSWITQMEFLLDPQGRLTSATIMKKSGIDSFDLAALEAFKDARIFPNPPPEMVQDDGFIHIRFSFNVNYRAPAVVHR